MLNLLLDRLIMIQGNPMSIPLHDILYLRLLVEQLDITLRLQLYQQVRSHQVIHQYNLFLIQIYLLRIQVLDLVPDGSHAE